MNDELARFVRTVRGRNLRETVAAVLLIVLFGAQLLLDDHSTLGVVGRVVIMLAALLIAFVTWKFLHIGTGELETFPPAECKEYWRQRLSVQARGLRWAWLWYVLPLLSGIVLICLGRQGAWGKTIASIAVPLVLAAIIGWVNVAASRSIAADRDRWFPPE